MKSHRTVQHRPSLPASATSQLISAHAPVTAMASAIREEYGTCVAIEYLQANGISQAEIQAFFTVRATSH